MCQPTVPSPSASDEVPGARREFTPLGRVRHVAQLATPTTVAAAGAALAHSRRRRFRNALSAASRRHGSVSRSLVARPGGRLTWENSAVPALEPAAAVVRPVAVATCDLDRPVLLGRSPFPLPLQIGHEAIAEVVDVGDEVREIKVGDRVVVPFQISCGDCSACRGGRTGNCTGVPPLSMYGFGIGGGNWGGAVTDELYVPYADAMLVPLPANVDPARVAGVADSVCDGYRHVAPHLPTMLAERGQFPVRIMAAQDGASTHSPSSAMIAGLTALWLGAEQVQYVDYRPWARHQATGLGLEALTPQQSRRSQRSPLVVDVTGTAHGLAAALASTANDGWCNSAGGLTRTARVPLGQMYARNVTFRLSRTHVRAVIPHVLELIQAGFDPGVVITDEVAWDEAPRALATHSTTDDTKLVITRA